MKKNEGNDFKTQNDIIGQKMIKSMEQELIIVIKKYNQQINLNKVVMGEVENNLKRMVKQREKLIEILEAQDQQQNKKDGDEEVRLQKKIQNQSQRHVFEQIYKNYELIERMITQNKDLNQIWQRVTNQNIIIALKFQNLNLSYLLLDMQWRRLQKDEIRTLMDLRKIIKLSKIGKNQKIIQRLRKQIKKLKSFPLYGMHENKIYQLEKKNRKLKNQLKQKQNEIEIMKEDIKKQFSMLKIHQKNYQNFKLLYRPNTYPYNQQRLILILI